MKENQSLEKQLSEKRDLKEDQTEENKQNISARNYYNEKNLEIEQLLDALSKIKDQKKGINIGQAITSKEVEVLIKFCVKEVILKDLMSDGSKDQ